MINSRNVNDLHPLAKLKCLEFDAECLKAGIDVLITCTHRDIECQDGLYAIGRTVKGANCTPKKPMGDKVTNAKGGDSYHQYQVAWDFVPVVLGKAMWNDAVLFTRCGEIAEKLGIEWAGRWKSFKESAHCQYTQGLTIKDFKAGNMIK
jgi:peptidoglycan L-alanyl-D-glutamate endopeptidase CwlK